MGSNNYYSEVSRARQALNMFRNGNDTVEIAKLTGGTEAHVCSLLEIARNEQIHALEVERKAAGMMHGRL